MPKTAFNAAFLIRPALVLFGSLALLTGLVYPLGITGFAQVLMPERASGSLIQKDGQVFGSRLIGRATEDPALFWGRLSATAEKPFNASASGGSNLSAGNPALRQAAQDRIEALRIADPGNTAPGIPHRTPAGHGIGTGAGDCPQAYPGPHPGLHRRALRERAGTESGVGGDEEVSCRRYLDTFLMESPCYP
jgi:hypothetical protein